jgi:hypothetical protein
VKQVTANLFLCLTLTRGFVPVSVLMAFKRAIIEDPHSVLSDWTDADGNACDWCGVICSAPQGSVISL